MAVGEDGWSWDIVKNSSGHSLGDLADVLIDNCVPLEDSMVHIDGLVEPVGAGSTLSVVAITMSILSETARELVRRGHKLVESDIML